MDFVVFKTLCKHFWCILLRVIVHFMTHFDPKLYFSGLFHCVGEGLHLKPSGQWLSKDQGWRPSFRCCFNSSRYCSYPLVPCIWWNLLQLPKKSVKGAVRHKPSKNIWAFMVSNDLFNDFYRFCQEKKHENICFADCRTFLSRHHLCCVAPLKLCRIGAKLAQQLSTNIERCDWPSLHLAESVVDLLRLEWSMARPISSCYLYGLSTFLD